MHVLQVQGDYVRLSIPSCSFGKIEAAVIKGDCRAVADLLTPVEVRALSAAPHRSSPLFCTCYVDIHWYSAT